MRPYRPKRDEQITQNYNSGIVRIYRVESTAAAGYQPVPEYTRKETLPFDEQALGINRLYLSRQNMAEIRRVIRVPLRPVNSQDIAMTSDGHQYRVDTVQTVKDVYPASLDLALTDVKQRVEVIE